MNILDDYSKTDRSLFNESFLKESPQIHLPEPLSNDIKDFIKSGVNPKYRNYRFVISESGFFNDTKSNFVKYESNLDLLSRIN